VLAPSGSFGEPGLLVVGTGRVKQGERVYGLLMILG
jgi:hypothetical protein